MKRAELIILLVFVIFSIASILTSIGGNTLVLDNERIPAHVYSMIIAGILGFSSLLRIILLLINSARSKSSAPDSKVHVAKISILLVLISILYILGISYIGFYISTAICVFITFWGFEGWNKSKIKTGIIFSIGMCLLLFVVFHFLNIYLPDTLLF